MHIIIINGAARSGKDTFVSDCMLFSKYYTYSLSTIDFVKDIAAKCGWNGEKDLKNRKFLSDLKDLLTEWDDIPYKKVTEEISLIEREFEAFDMNKDNLFIFVHCREPQEIQKFKDRLNAITLCIRRAAAENAETSNHADAEVLNYEYDYYIDNNGTFTELEDKAIAFLDMLKK